jgi:hypothetical protein
MMGRQFQNDLKECVGVKWIKVAKVRVEQKALVNFQVSTNGGEFPDWLSDNQFLKGILIDGACTLIMFKFT